MNYVLLRNGLPLVIIKSDEKKEYLAALNRADVGDLASLCEYIGNRLLWSLDLYITAARGGDIDEDNDLDKELELLKKDLHQIPNQFEREKTFKDVSLIMERSIAPLFLELNSKFEKIKDLFVKFDSDLRINCIADGALSDKFLFTSFDFLFGESFDGYQIISSSLNFKCIALKKVVYQKNIIYDLEIEFDDFSYRIFNETNNQIFFTLPYKSFLSNNNIDSIVKNVMGNIIEEIKSSTNIN